MTAIVTQWCFPPRRQQSGKVACGSGTASHTKSGANIENISALLAVFLMNRESVSLAFFKTSILTMRKEANLAWCELADSSQIRTTIRFDSRAREPITTVPGSIVALWWLRQKQSGEEDPVQTQASWKI